MNDLNKIEKILVPIDNSENSAEALRHAVDLSSLGHAKVFALHVVEMSSFEKARVFGTVRDTPLKYINEKIINKGKMETEDFIKKSINRTKSVKIESLVRIGNPFVEIIAAADEKKVDLIIMGTHHRKGLFHLFMGSVAEKVLKHSNCAVLTIKSEEKKFEAA
jgi:universal stress protein A